MDQIPKFFKTFDLIKSILIILVVKQDKEDFSQNFQICNLVFLHNG